VYDRSLPADSRKREGGNIMASMWDYFKAQIGSTDLSVYKTTLKKGGKERGAFNIDGVDDHYTMLLVIVDNIGSFLGPDWVKYDPYFCIVEMGFGKDVIEFDVSSMTYKLTTDEEI